MVVAIVALAAIAAVTPFKSHIRVENFHVVEPGQIYRGAAQKPGPLQRLIKQHGIRTIVCLVDPDPEEQAIAESLGVRWVWMPIGDSALAVTFDTLEKLADLLAEPANQPVFYHCRRGVYRSNLAQAVYRMRCDGWTLDQALADLRRTGFDPDVSGGDNCCAEALRWYYKDRVLPGLTDRKEN
jgi:protein tyrosine phosphatase (PTP) superfamily phosphohydrolase (DUF442 family)